MPMDSGSFGFLLFSLDVLYNDEICSSSVYSLLEKRFPAFCAVGWQNLQLYRTAAEAYCLRHYSIFSLVPVLQLWQYVRQIRAHLLRRPRII